jgi:hypothetical protein
LDPIDGADWEADLTSWQAECQSSRQAAAGRGLDDVGMRRRGQPYSLRWIYVHMIEEYARHNGHADLIRRQQPLGESPLSTPRGWCVRERALSGGL